MDAIGSSAGGGREPAEQIGRSIQVAGHRPSAADPDPDPRSEGGSEAAAGLRPRASSNQGIGGRGGLTGAKPAFGGSSGIIQPAAREEASTVTTLC